MNEGYIDTQVTIGFNYFQCNFFCGIASGYYSLCKGDGKKRPTVELFSSGGY